MRRALVVYESLFGHARTVAHAAAAGLAELMPVEIFAAADGPPGLGAGVGLLVVGCPNHHLDMPTPESRRQAARDFGARGAGGAGLREWLATAATGSTAIPAAVFDTRLVRSRPPRAGDHAPRTEQKRYEPRLTLITSPAHFYVASATGPLISGEQERAHDWGRTLASTILAVAH